jgi:hypothetical protein
MSHYTNRRNAINRNLSTPKGAKWKYYDLGSTWLTRLRRLKGARSQFWSPHALAWEESIAKPSDYPHYGSDGYWHPISKAQAREIIRPEYRNRIT